MKKYLSLIVLIFPWFIRKKIYTKIFKYTILNNARIGLSWIYVKKLHMEEYSYIGHLNVCKGIDSLKMGQHSFIGNLNWITGFPSDILDSLHFKTEKERKPQLILEKHSAITSRHIIDCTNTIIIGEFTTIAGLGSQILTHSIDVENSTQSSASVIIGKYCFIGTNCVFLKGSKVPDYSVVGAKTLVNKALNEEYSLYGGVPVRKIKEMDKDNKYFNRIEGYIY